MLPIGNRHLSLPWQRKLWYTVFIRRCHYGLDTKRSHGILPVNRCTGGSVGADLSSAGSTAGEQGFHSPLFHRRNCSILRYQGQPFAGTYQKTSVSAFKQYAHTGTLLRAQLRKTYNPGTLRRKAAGRLRQRFPAEISSLSADVRQRPQCEMGRKIVPQGGRNTAERPSKRSRNPNLTEKLDRLPVLE